MAAATSLAAPAKAAARTAPTFAHAVRDATYAALIMLGLSIPLLALKTEQSAGGLILEQRWGLVAICCGIVFAGRLALRLLGLRAIPSRASSAAARGVVTTKAEPEAQSGVTLSAVLSPLFLGIALAFPIIAYLGSGGLTESRYWVDLGILILTYVMLGWGLNIVV
ncbi:DUF3382 domain-containing protein, partial [uncultured Enterovirga sp.]|uniref:DUF3382 domain-containing protein n=1 Tax=uncultured Enterovirga sp. TaxID=2026352 RepID=UPI0035CB4213